MKEDPAELRQLLAAEIERHLDALGESEELSASRAAMHAVRGSAAMANEADLALVLGQLGAKIRSAEPGARARAAELLRKVRDRLAHGLPPFATTWPEPPPALGPARVDPRYRGEYVTVMRDRLSELDDALAAADEPASLLERARRTLHAMKGAALGLSDDATVWYLHGLESQLRRAQHDESLTTRTLRELTDHRSVLSLLVEDPERALGMLRARADEPGNEAPLSSHHSTTRTSAPPPSRTSPPSRSGLAGPIEEEMGYDEAPFRVPGTAIDRLLERVERVTLAREELTVCSEASRLAAMRLRELSADLLEALRLIGPPKPWGAPAAALSRVRSVARELGAASDDIDNASTSIRRSAESLHADAGATRAELAALRRTTARWLFDRVAGSVARVASDEGRLVAVRVQGAEVPIDRWLAERLLDPMLQLARNAVAHGIRAPEARIAAGKKPAGVVTLRAQRAGPWLRLVVSDDGEGVDFTEIRHRAVAAGLMPENRARAAQQEELLALLLLPGLTTRHHPDLLAGRGIGLDVVQDTVRRLGGTLRLGCVPAGGLQAVVEVSSEGGVADVLWLGAVGSSFALPVVYTGDVGLPSGSTPTVHLATCLGLDGPRAGSFALQLRIDGVDPIRIAVDRIGGVEEVNIRPVPKLVAAAGPFGGAVLRGNGTLELVLDATRLAATAWSRAP